MLSFFALHLSSHVRYDCNSLCCPLINTCDAECTHCNKFCCPLITYMLQIAVKAMESEQTKLDRVLKILGFLYQHFDGVTDAKVRQVMLEGLEF